MPREHLQWKTLEARGLTEIQLTVELLTPLFGGGVGGDPRKSTPHVKPHDPVTLFRGASMRGQLRFWWRVTQHLKEGTINQEQASTIWGAASKPAKVSLSVRDRNQESPSRKVFEAAGHRPTQEDLAYGAFPLKPTDSASKDPRTATPGTLYGLGAGINPLSADLILRISNLDREDVRGVRDALCAWLILGGLGGRTRRGFGAVYSQWLASEGIDVHTWLRDHHLPFRESPDCATPLDALQFGLKKLREFRQGVRMGRNPGNSKPAGRSRWPEAESIRKLAKSGSPQHATRLVDVDKFPRAAFGMPIIFHFQNDEHLPDFQLTPTGAERMASPLILRPYRTNNQMFRCLAVLLPPAYRLAAASELTLHDPKDKKRSFPVSHHLTPLEARSIQPLTNQPDPLCAFLDFFQPQTHQESR